MQGREIDPLVAAIPAVWPRRPVDGTEIPAGRAAGPDRGRRSRRPAVGVLRRAVQLRVRRAPVKRCAPCSSRPPARCRRPACPSARTVGCLSRLVSSNSWGVSTLETNELAFDPCAPADPWQERIFRRFASDMEIHADKSRRSPLRWSPSARYRGSNTRVGNNRTWALRPSTESASPRRLMHRSNSESACG